MVDDDLEDDVLQGAWPSKLSHAARAFRTKIQSKPIKTCWNNYTGIMSNYLRANVVAGRPTGRVGIAPNSSSTLLAMEEKGLGGEYEQPEESVVEDTEPVWVVDLFSCWSPGRRYSAWRRIHRLGLPCGVPRLGIQVFVRALCDCTPFRPPASLPRRSVLNRFDAYLSIRAEVDRRVRRELGRDTPNWLLKNTCPAGLTSRGRAETDAGRCSGPKTAQLPQAFERRQRELSFHRQHYSGRVQGALDNRVAPGDFFLPRDYVEEFAKDTVDVFDEGVLRRVRRRTKGRGCDERWENMKEDVYPARAWGMYDETGIFPGSSWSPWVFLVAWICEKRGIGKYGLAVHFTTSSKTREIAMGIDVGCQTGKMVKGASPRLSPSWRATTLQCLVGSFHGLRHGRLCQVVKLGNHADTCDAYQGLSANFRSSSATSTDALSSSRLVCRRCKKRCAVFNVETRDVFDTWLRPGEGVSTHLDKGAVGGDAGDGVLPEAGKPPGARVWSPPILHPSSSRCLQTARPRDARVLLRPSCPPPQTKPMRRLQSKRRRLETQRRHAVEVAVKSLAAVQDLEVKLDITTRWVPGCEEWDRAAKLRALDQLQGLVVARLFELTKVNMSGTGYKLRKHIAKALQVRSKAVNCRGTKWWGNAFLAEFDLLREGREDIRTEPWALPAGRAAMDQHFKSSARRRSSSDSTSRSRGWSPSWWTRKASSSTMRRAFVRRDWAGWRCRWHAIAWSACASTLCIWRRLTKLSKEDGFTASITPGVSVSTERRVPMRDAVVGVPSATHTGAPAPNTVEEEEEDGRRMGTPSTPSRTSGNFFSNLEALGRVVSAAGMTAEGLLMAR
ncbi:hypothetical protein B0H14DRAFT_2642048 [Mycena olivaceomarginata]|nr:hypothetical protein B0H14DRAFT_2642048 [Mycena olivaceomarginata]